MDQDRQTETWIRAVGGQVSVCLSWSHRPDRDIDSGGGWTRCGWCRPHVMHPCFADFVCFAFGGMGGVEMSGTRWLLLVLCGPRGKSKSSANGSISRTSILRRVCCSSVLKCVAVCCSWKAYRAQPCRLQTHTPSSSLSMHPVSSVGVGVGGERGGG